MEVSKLISSDDHKGAIVMVGSVVAVAVVVVGVVVVVVEPETRFCWVFPFPLLKPPGWVAFSSEDDKVR